jgi:hypothetical protein
MCITYLRKIRNWYFYVGDDLVHQSGNNIFITHVLHKNNDVSPAPNPPTAMMVPMEQQAIFVQHKCELVIEYILMVTFKVTSLKYSYIF